ncbi:CDP-glucose 4,6-dehydratase [Bacillus salipaludis]|uniref:CDP-glucose 4,6-dehydratase n=1 Tax=Bacillus salipaludis TaxID=2547811 RepID=UPI003D1F4D25
MPNHEFWNEKQVFVTGHTGFKGTWLSLWLSSLGAKVTGYSLKPPTSPNLFDLTNVAADCQSCYGDINDFEQLEQTIKHYQPDIIFHLAAQPLVRNSYQNPIETFKTNVLGTAHVLEAARHIKSVRVIVNITSDKCYENTMVKKSFQEHDRIGGHDPYSASKGCAELVTESYRRSFFQTTHIPTINLASARAGNVIGGGDWAEERLMPDVMRSFLEGQKLIIRNRNAVRPWQHVLEPLCGYILLAERLWDDSSYSGGWNFGPSISQECTVQDVLDMTMQLWGRKIDITYDNNKLHPHEASYLQLDSSKASKLLRWVPKLSTKEAVHWTVEWFRNYESGTVMGPFTMNQIKRYEQIKGV